MNKNLLSPKSLLFFFVLLFVSPALWAQAPQRINYQAVARDNDQLVANGTVDVKFRIRSSDCQSGALQFEEEHVGVPTNAYGLFSIQIGGGNLLNGSFGSINWNAGTYFLQVEIRVNGGSYTTLPCSNLKDQFVSVPYALNGPPGPTGLPGATGATGQNGTNGANGATGPTGLPGSANIQGVPKYLLKAQTPSFATSSVVIEDSLSSTDIRIGIANPSPKGILHVGSSSNTKDAIFQGGYNFAGVNSAAYGVSNTSQMIFNPYVGAFRVGLTIGSEWDGNKLGNASLAMGAGVEASSQGSMAIGAYSRAAGPGSMTLGSSLQADSNNCIVIGYGNSLTQSDYLRINRRSSVALGAGARHPSIFMTSNPAGKLRPAKVAVGGYSNRGNLYPNVPMNTLEVNGSLGMHVTPMTNSGTLTDTNCVVLVSSNITVTLPSSANAPGRVYYIKKISSTSLTGLKIGVVLNDKLEGATNGNVSFGGTNMPECVTVVSDGIGGWWVLSRQ